jgi:UPF0755 protein
VSRGEDRWGRAKPGRGLLVSLASAAATLFLLLVFAGIVFYASFYGPGPKARQGRETDVVLRRGAGVSEIAATLERAGVISSSNTFKAFAQLTGKDRGLVAGEYVFPSRASLASVLRKLKDGDVVHHYVRVPEGLTSAQVAAILKANPVLVGDVAVPPEGSLLPETYEVTRGQSRAEVVRKMRAARDALLAELWTRRASGLPFSTPEQAVILASIVERETGLPNERPRVAAVFVNRLEKGIPLGSDPTIIYALSGGVPLGHGLTKSELETETPYNTRRVVGLPPTPIANPGKASLAAVLNPAKTDDLYFVANGTGGHSFAATFEEHQRNVARWRQIEAGRKASVKPTAAPAPAATH